LRKDNPYGRKETGWSSEKRGQARVDKSAQKKTNERSERRVSQCAKTESRLKKKLRRPGRSGLRKKRKIVRYLGVGRGCAAPLGTEKEIAFALGVVETRRCSCWGTRQKKRDLVSGQGRKLTSSSTMPKETNSSLHEEPRVEGYHMLSIVLPLGKGKEVTPAKK